MKMTVNQIVELTGHAKVLNDYLDVVRASLRKDSAAEGALIVMGGKLMKAQQ